jgi:hypothetical protein
VSETVAALGRVVHGQKLPALLRHRPDVTLAELERVAQALATRRGKTYENALGIVISAWASGGSVPEERQEQGARPGFVDWSVYAHIPGFSLGGDMTGIGEVQP